MSPLSHLPLGLLTLSFVILTLTSASLSSIPNTRSNISCPLDPFQHLRLHAAPKPSDPVCCLIPLSSEPLATTAEFISFEEWKSKQLELQAHAQSINLPSPETSVLEAPPLMASPATLGDTDTSLSLLTEPVPTLSPHHRVPLADRFNYASLDCSARVHTSHRSARSPSAILSSKKDRYMLSPCSSDPNFVVVELCDDIRIDIVQLANFEFFSGVFRDFKISVAQTYTPDKQSWVEAGTYRAKNIRGVQSFRPLVELRPFYRYIRIDFLTHYGNEFYCPISLLRVYGLNQMEEWKREAWQKPSEDADVKAFSDAGDNTKAGNEMNAQNSMTAETITTDGSLSTPAQLISSPTRVDASHVMSENPVTGELTGTQQSSIVQYAGRTASPAEIPVSEPTISLHVSVTPDLASSIVTIPQPTNAHPHNHSRETRTEASLFITGTNITNITIPNVTVTNTSISYIQTIIPVPSPPPIPSGESIYRTIINRLAMLETNTTLYQKYVEEQTLQVREVLRRLEEEVGRLEGISKAQQVLISKTVNELDRRQRQMEQERWELLKKVNHLADEVILEKRLGIAQLCLLTTVLIFMALTRGSRTDIISFLDGTIHRLNSFSRRSPWSSTDLTQHYTTRNDRSPTPTPGTTLRRRDYTYQKAARAVAISAPAGEEVFQDPVSFPVTLPARPRTSHNSHRPCTPRHHEIARCSDSERPVGRLHRSNSHTTPANTLISARRFARTAHLHEVKLSMRRRTKANQSDEDDLNSAEDRLKGTRKLWSKSGENPLNTESFGSTGKPHVYEGSEVESSWVDTEPGSEGGIDHNDRDSEETNDQEVEISTEQTTTLRSPFLSTPPRPKRRAHDHSSSFSGPKCN